MFLEICAKEKLYVNTIQCEDNLRNSGPIGQLAPSQCLSDGKMDRVDSTSNQASSMTGLKK